MDITTEIENNLRKVYDPEISINILDLGLIYHIDIDAMPIVTITHTLTSAFCPAADIIVEDIKEAVLKVDGVHGCEVITTFDPPFGPWAMSEEAKLALGVWDDYDMGIPDF